MNVQYSIDVLEGKQQEIKSILKQGMAAARMFDKKNGSMIYTSEQLEQRMKELSAGIRLLKAVNNLEYSKK